jgi:hypothetical protein
MEELLIEIGNYFKAHKDESFRGSDVVVVMTTIILKKKGIVK